MPTGKTGVSVQHQRQMHQPRELPDWFIGLSLLNGKQFHQEGGDTRKQVVGLTEKARTKLDIAVRSKGDQVRQCVFGGRLGLVVG